MNASTRRFRSSWLSDGSLLSRPDPGDELAFRSVNVSYFFIFGGGVFSSVSWLLLRRTCDSHVSDFFRCLVNGIERPSVIVFHVVSSVSCRFGFGFDTPKAFAPAKVPKIVNLIYSFCHYLISIQKRAHWGVSSKKKSGGNFDFEWQRQKCSGSPDSNRRYVVSADLWPNSLYDPVQSIQPPPQQTNA